MRCPCCGDLGLIRVNYRSGEPFDIAICDCRHGEPFRIGGEALVRARCGIEGQSEHQVAYRELFDGETKAARTDMGGGDYLEVGKTRKAKL